MATKKSEDKASKATESVEKKQYTEDDPEYWALMARSLGNPVPDFEDDSEFVDKNGVVIKENTPK